MQRRLKKRLSVSVETVKKPVKEETEEMGIPPPSPSRSSVHKSLHKRGLADEEMSMSPPRKIEWKRTAMPSRGQYEASNLLGNSGSLVSTNKVLQIHIIQVEANILQHPIECSFRVKTVEELVLAVTKKLDLKFVPVLYYYNDLDNEDMEIEDINILPCPTKIRVRQPDAEQNFHELLELLKSKVSIKDRRYRLKTYPNCFIGSEFVDCVLEHQLLGDNTTRSNATAFGNGLLESGYISHVVDPKKRFKDRYLFYRFVEGTDTEADGSSHLSFCTYIWGRGSFSPSVLEVPVTIVSISCGAMHTLLLSSEGKVYSWGAGKQGQLGHPAIRFSREPQLVEALANLTVQAVYAGYNLSAAKAGEKSLFLWGSYLAHCCTPKPTLIPFPEFEYCDHTCVVDVAFGYTHCVVLLSTDSNPPEPPTTYIYTWGNNNYGQLGLGFLTDEPVLQPSRVSGLDSVCVVSIDAGVNFTGALSQSGVLYAWGANTGDFLSLDSKRFAIPIPRKVRGIKGIIEQFQCGSNYFAAISSKGELITWGHTHRLGSTFDQQPKKLPGVRDVSAVACGDKHMLIQTNSNNIHSIYSLGINTDGQLGVDTSSLPSSIAKGVRLPIDRVIQLSAGRNSSIAIITEDILEIFIATAQRGYGEAAVQRRKLLAFTRSDPTGSIQVSARKILRLENRHSHKKKSRPEPNRFAERPHSRSLSNIKYDKQHFELFRHSSVYSITISKYCLFDRATGMNSTYKFLWDEITIHSGGCIPARFAVIPPQSQDYNVLAHPQSGDITKDTIDIQFQIIALRAGSFEDMVFLDVESDGLCYRHVIYFHIECQAQVLVPEFDFEKLQGGQELGSGAAGTVSKVNLDGRDVAVKFFRVHDLSVEEINSFRNEMMISSNLQHPNIIDCLGVCTQFPHLALVLEFFPLKDLRNLISHRADLLTTELILRISMDIVEGMIYLHNRMIMHRDLKPDNVLMVSLDLHADVCAKLTDFGTSTVVSTDNKCAEVGTARYMPLEVLEPNPTLVHDRRMIDVYSFGIVLWEMYSHILPYEKFRFTGQIIEAQKAGHVNQFKSEWDVPEELENVVCRCMSASPLDRPDFEAIMVILIQVAESFSSMNAIVERLRKKYGHRRALTRNTRSSLLAHQIKTLDSKIDKLNRREEEALQQLAAIQAELEKIRETKKEYERNKQSIQAELDEPEGFTIRQPRPPSV